MLVRVLVSKIYWYREMRYHDFDYYHEPYTGSVSRSVGLGRIVTDLSLLSLGYFSPRFSQNFFRKSEKQKMEMAKENEYFAGIAGNSR